MITPLSKRALQKSLSLEWQVAIYRAYSSVAVHVTRTNTVHVTRTNTICLIMLLSKKDHPKEPFVLGWQVAIQRAYSSFAAISHG